MLFLISIQTATAFQEQLLLVLTQDMNAAHGIMQPYQRNCLRCKWYPVGKPVAVVIGKNGLAPEIKKREGDLRTPAGIFYLPFAFGFLPMAINMPYLKLSNQTICVDDPESRYYNQVLDVSSVKKPDWNSSEKMREIWLYQYGVSIAYNVKPVPLAGSCIFMHVWRNDHTGTAGCIAMSASDLKRVLYWLNASKQPKIAILTRDLYSRYQTQWNLPPLDPTR